MKRLATMLLFLGACPIVADASKVVLDDLDVPAGFGVAGNSDGAIALFNAAEATLSVWNAEGERETSCMLSGPFSADSSRYRIAFHEDRVLIASESPTGALETGPTEGPVGVVHVEIVNAGTCKASGGFDISGFPPTVRIAPSRRGWIVSNYDPLSGETVIKTFDDRGKQRDEIKIPRAYITATVEGFDEETALEMIPVAAGRDIWLLGASSYVIWEPARPGRSAREIPVPDCLFTKGKEVSGEQAGETLLGLSTSEADQKILAEFIESSGQDLRFLVPSARPGWVSSYRDLVGVIAKEPDGRFRLDVWSAVFEAPVAVRYLPSGITEPRLMMSDHAAWVLSGGRFIRVDLPEAMVEPIPDLCADNGYLARLRKALVD